MYIEKHKNQGSPRTPSATGQRSTSFRRGPSSSGSSYSSSPSRSSSYGPRRSGGGSGSSFRGGSRSGGGRGPSKPMRRGGRIDPSIFVNRAIITEEIVKFVPEHKFTDFKIDEVLKKSIVARKYEFPTPIQDRAIPHVLNGADIVGIANTGTGKTAAFLIPLIHKVLQDRKQHVLIVVPTRELAIQIDSELKAFVKGMKIFSVCCVGGMSIGKQIADLRYANEFIIGTPGRLKDLIDRKKIDLAKFKTIVLDEADQMLDMGFINDMRFLMAGMPVDRQTLFFSATLSKDIEKLINDFLREPVKISVKTQDTSKNIDQDVVRVRGANKIDVLRDLLAQDGFNKVLIFGRTKHGVEKLSQMLIQKGFKAESIHGDKNHYKRQSALRLFKENHVKILVATDVAARGLDISDISHVINFDVPETYEDYVHRIGRTGRGDKKGKALTFID